MDENKLKRVNYLRKEIKKLEAFIRAIDVVNPDNHRMFCHLEIKTRTTTKIKLMGWRDFDAGEHNSMIDVPLSLMSDIVDISRNRLSELKQEYQEL